jgi:hypothetical protein
MGLRAFTISSGVRSLLAPSCGSTGDQQFIGE